MTLWVVGTRARFVPLFSKIDIIQPICKAVSDVIGLGQDALVSGGTRSDGPNGSRLGQNLTECLTRASNGVRRKIVIGR